MTWEYGLHAFLLFSTNACTYIIKKKKGRAKIQMYATHPWLLNTDVFIGALLSREVTPNPLALLVMGGIPMRLHFKEREGMEGGC